MKDTCDIKKTLLRQGVEPTAHRMKILKIIAQADTALMPKDILVKLREKKAFDKVTLYRTLDLLVDKKILRRFAGMKGTMCYEIICAEHNPHHAHFVCRHCGQMECLDDINIAQLTAFMKKKISFQPETIDLKVEGVCGDCKEKQKEMIR